MNREDILRMAREARLVSKWLELCPKDEEALVRFAALVAAAEREACARVCEHQPHWVSCVAAIRARGEHMTDRELLEFAAKAVGMEGMRYASPYTGMSKMLDPARPETTGSIGPNWNPITNDGDALRLMVRLRLHARQFPIVDDGMDAPLGMVEVWRVDDDDPLHVEFMHSGDDRLVATRRAIVRAAAEIGRQMP